MHRNKYFFSTVTVLILLGTSILLLRSSFSNTQLYILLSLWGISFIGLTSKTLLGFCLSKTFFTILFFLLCLISYSNFKEIKIIILTFGSLICLLALENKNVVSKSINSSNRDEERILFSIPKQQKIFYYVFAFISANFLNESISELNSKKTSIISLLIFLIAFGLLVYFIFLLSLTFYKRMLIFVPRGLVVIDNINFKGPIRIEQGELSFEQVGQNFKEEYASKELNYKDLTLGCNQKCYMLNVKHALVEDKVDGIKIDSLYISLQNDIHHLGNATT